MPKARETATLTKTRAGVVQPESAAERAARHTSVMFVDLERSSDGEVGAAFSVPSGGVSCDVTIEGKGPLPAELRISSGGIEVASGALQINNGWIGLVHLPETSTWWTGVDLRVGVTQNDEQIDQLRVSVHRAARSRSMVEATFLPARRADAWLPESSPMADASITGAIDRLLETGEVEEAIRLMLAALASNLDGVRNSHGAKVLKAAAENADFTVSNDGLKLFIAMSS